MQAGYSVVTTSRQPLGLQKVSQVHQVEHIEDTVALRSAMEGVNYVIHLAARTHVMTDKSLDPLAEYRRINVEGTKATIKAASEMGVKRLVFLSSIKVNGEQTAEQPYTSTDKPIPVDAYGISKAEAEEHIQSISAQSDLEMVVIRTPLVYGPNVRGNFLSLMSLVHKGLPMPFGAITKNRRSLIYVENLVSALIATLQHTAASGQTFLVRDGTDLSTAALTLRIQTALNKPEKLISIPPGVLKGLLSILGKKKMADRILGSLTIDDQKTRDTIEWIPDFSVEEGLKKTADWYLSQKTKN